MSISYFDKELHKFMKIYITKIMIVHIVRSLYIQVKLSLIIFITLKITPRNFMHASFTIIKRYSGISHFISFYLKTSVNRRRKYSMFVKQQSVIPDLNRNVFNNKPTT